MDSKVLEQVKKLMDIDPVAAAARIQKYLEKERNIPLNIGVTGECGSGKSTFVNAFRGMSNMDEGAAPTGCKETTTEVIPYTHPNYPNVVLWDLPGVGSTRFPAKKYLKLVGFEKFDFFIIISDTRFRENDVKLALEIKKMGKEFYFVRSKIDNDLRAEEMSTRHFSTEKTLEKIREDCIQGLEQQGIESPQVFLLSSFHLHLYDFPLLHETLSRELPTLKRNALLLAMPNISLKIIKKKKKVFQSNIKWYAAVSAAVAAVPVPGLSAAVDLSLMVAVVTQYVVGFGLDASSLRRLSVTTGVSFNDLKTVLKTILTATDITKDLLRKLLTKLADTSTLMAAEEASRFIPILGVPVGMALSYTATYNALNFFLDVLADEAQRVFVRALGLNTSV